MKKSLKEHLDIIVKLIENNSDALLIEELEDLTKRHPKLFWGWLYMAHELIHVARYDEAMSAIKKAEKYGKQEGQIKIYALKERLYRKKGDFRTAEYWAKKAAEMDDEGVHYILLGSVLARQGKFEEAKKAHMKAIKLGKADTDEAHLNLGYIYRAEKNYGEALKHACKALEICPDYREAERLKKDLEEVMKAKR
ncbi:MAG: tetratricopeptide repeat protein [Rhodospirillales bacterium]|nr:tetratricopeptide repeat protein [Rhodospirillales bacterium]